jgi:hemolysin III
MATLDVHGMPKPSWRGRLHTWAFIAGLPAGVWLILRADHGAATVAAAVYAFSVVLVFGTSASYHRLARTPRAQTIMQRLDHSMIYVLIAGTYTPICLVALPPAWGIPVLAVVAIGAVTGIVLKLTAFSRLGAVAHALYPVLGWTAVVAMPALVAHLTTTQLVLVVAGGVAYTAGIPVLLRRRPDPWPAKFGYHEVWHVFTVAAGGLHFAAVGLLLT